MKVLVADDHFLIRQSVRNITNRRCIPSNGIGLIPFLLPFGDALSDARFGHIDKCREDIVADQFIPLSRDGLCSMARKIGNGTAGSGLIPPKSGASGKLPAARPRA